MRRLRRWLGAVAALVLAGCSPEKGWSRSAGRELQQGCLGDEGEGARTLGSLRRVPTWERLFLVTPYSTPADVAATNHFTWTGSDFGMDSRDDAHVALFVRGGDVVQAEEWPRRELEPSLRLTQERFLEPSRRVRCLVRPAAPVVLELDDEAQRQVSPAGR